MKLEFEIKKMGNKSPVYMIYDNGDKIDTKETFSVIERIDNYGLTIQASNRWLEWIIGVHMYVNNMRLNSIYQDVLRGHTVVMTVRLIDWENLQETYI